jgi:hypothetical protein
MDGNYPKYGSVENSLYVEQTNCSVGNSSSLQAKKIRDWRKFLRGVEISSIFMKYRGRAVLDDFQKIEHIVVEILLRTHSRPSTY